MLGPLFVGLIVLVAILYHGRAAFSFVGRHRALTGLTAALVCVATAGAAAWTLHAGLVGGAGELQGSTTWSTSSVVLWPLQTIAAFPFRNQPGPIFVYPLVGGLVCLLTYVALRTARGLRRLALATALVAALTLPYVLTWLSRDGRGVMWQGRYGLPLAVGFVVIAGLVLDRARVRPARGLLVGGGIVLAVSSAASLTKIVRDELGNRASSADGAWLAPPAWLLVVASVLAFAVAVAAIWAPAEPAEPVS
jgi:hypothetical protein